MAHMTILEHIQLSLKTKRDNGENPTLLKIGGRAAAELKKQAVGDVHWSQVSVSAFDKLLGLQVIEHGAEGFTIE